jgi:hypothetical protein
MLRHQVSDLRSILRCILSNAAKEKSMARKIVQIASARMNDNDMMVIALAGDGTLWRLSVQPDMEGEDKTWIQLPDLPEPRLSEDFSRDPILG